MPEKLEEAVEVEKKPIVLSQLLGVVYSGGSDTPGKNVLATDDKTNLQLLPFDNPEESVEEFLDRGQKAGTITILKEAAANTQRYQMLSTSENLLPAIDLKGFSTIYYAHISTTDDISRIDAVNGPDAFEILVLEDGLPETYIFADEAFYDGLANCQIVTARNDTILLIPIKGDPKVGTAWIMTVALDNVLNNTIGYSGAAGESLLSRLITVIFRDIEPLHGGERRPQLARLVEFYKINFEEFITTIVDQVTQELTALAKTKKLFAYLDATSRLNKTVAKLKGRLKSEVTSTEQLLTLCAKGLLPDEKEKNETNELQKAYNGIVNDLTKSVLLASMLKELLEAAAFDTTKYYTPAQILNQFRTLGTFLINQDSRVDQAETDLPDEPLAVNDLLVERTQADSDVAATIQLRNPARKKVFDDLNKGFRDALGVPQKPILETPTQRYQPDREPAESSNRIRIELQSSRQNEVGGNITLSPKYSFGQRIGTDSFVLEKGSRWPSNHTYEAKYNGPTIFFYLQPVGRSKLLELLIISDPEIQLLQNGLNCPRSGQNTNMVLLPGDVFTVIDTKTNATSEFVLSYNSRIELLSTSQLVRPHTTLEAAALRVENTATEKQVIGYIITDEINSHLDNTVNQQLEKMPKEFTWNGVGTLTYDCSLSSKRELTLKSNQLLFDSYVYALLEFDQTTLPTQPNLYSRKGEFKEIEFAVGSHLIAHNSELGITHHLKVLPSGLIVTYSERKSISPEFIESRGPIKRDFSHLDRQRFGPETSNVQYFEKPTNGTLGATLDLNSLSWNTNMGGNSKTSTFYLSTFDGLPDEFLSNDLMNWYKCKFSVTASTNRSQIDRSLILSVQNSSNSSQIPIEWCLNGKATSDKNAPVLFPGDIVSILNPGTNNRSVFFYDYTKNCLELVQTENVINDETYSLEDLRDVPQPYSILGYLGKISLYSESQEATNYDKSIWWPDTRTSIRLEVDSNGCFVGSRLSFNLSIFSYEFQGINGDTYIPKSGSDLQLKPGDQIVATNVNTNERYVLKILPSGLIVSYTEERDDARQQTFEPRAIDQSPYAETSRQYDKIIEFARSGSQSLGFQLPQGNEKVLPNRYHKIGECRLDTFEDWPVQPNPNEEYDGYSVVITISTDNIDGSKMFISVDHLTEEAADNVSLLNNNYVMNRSAYTAIVPGDVITLVNNTNHKSTTFVFTYNHTLELVSSDELYGNQLLQVKNEFSLIPKPYKVIGYVGSPQNQAGREQRLEKYDKHFGWSNVGYFSASILQTGKLLSLQFTNSAGVIKPIRKVVSNYPPREVAINEGEEIRHGDHIVYHSEVDELTHHVQVLMSGMVVTYTTNE